MSTSGTSEVPLFSLPMMALDSNLQHALGWCGDEDEGGSHSLLLTSQSQLRCFGHVIVMPSGCLLLEIFQACSETPGQTQTILYYGISTIP